MTDAELRQSLMDRRDAVERRVADACRRANRDRGDVTIVAVTKYVGPEAAAVLHDLGLTDLAESRPQELWRKAAALPAAVRWHLVGHLQRNKVEQTLPTAQLIHSADSVRLIEAVERAAAKRGRPADVLIEVNLSGEAAKTGMPPHELPALRDVLDRSPNVRPLGLMTMAAAGRPESARPTFAALRDLRDRLAWPGLRHLSMGMTGDFEVAIEEGATLVRLGSCYFEGLPK
jgi:hypothetical protein